MKLIRSGGVNATLVPTDEAYKQYGFGNYFMSQIRSELEKIIQNNGKIALCVAAKPNKEHYNQRLIDLDFKIDDFTILGRDDAAQWQDYSAVLMLGGETKELYSWLESTKFNLNSLKRCEILGGDSAGAYVLSGKTLWDYQADGSSVEIKDGFLPKLNQLMAAHINNTHYHQPALTAALNKWCETNGVEYIELKENELNSIDI